MVLRCESGSTTALSRVGMSGACPSMATNPATARGRRVCQPPRHRGRWHPPMCARRRPRGRASSPRRAYSASPWSPPGTATPKAITGQSTHPAEPEPDPEPQLSPNDAPPVTTEHQEAASELSGRRTPISPRGTAVGTRVAGQGEDGTRCGGVGPSEVSPRSGGDPRGPGPRCGCARPGGCRCSRGACARSPRTGPSRGRCADWCRRERRGATA